MLNHTNKHLPKLRPLDPQPASQNGRQLLVLRDPLHISDRVVAMPYELAPLLALCDGTRTSYQLRTALLTRYGLQVSAEIVERFLDVCDEGLLLDNDRFRAAQADALAQYRAAAHRPPALAGLSYPDDPAGLAGLFAGYTKTAPAMRPGPVSAAPRPLPAHAAIISPHIDYQRGGPVYASVWSEAAELVRAADLAVVFGTDHYGGAGELTLTRQSYATPFGILPTPGPLVDALVRSVGGPERAFTSELHHRSEHAIELAVTWLHYVRRDLAPLPVLPILCGSFHQFVAGQGHPDQDPAIGALVYQLAALTAGQRVVVVAGADLAHVGPAFGGAPQGPEECGHVHAADQEIIARVCALDARGFFDAVRQVGDRYNVCGLAPIYLTLRTLAALVGSDRTGHSGRQIAYDTCPADEADTSFVSICGVILE